MPKNLTKAELLSDRERLQRENTVLSYALYVLGNRLRPDAMARVSEPNGGRYTYTLYASDQPHGGILITRFRYPKQRDGWSASYFIDQIGRHWLPEQLEHHCAIDNLRIEAKRRLEVIAQELPNG